MISGVLSKLKNCILFEDHICYSSLVKQTGRLVFSMNETKAIQELHPKDMTELMSFLGFGNI